MPHAVVVPALRGATSLVHLVLVAGAQCILSAPWALWVCAWLSNLLFVIGVWRLGRLSELPSYLIVSLVLISQIQRSGAHS